MKRTLIVLTACAATALAASGVVHADPDTDFSGVLHTHGIYGQRDHNAWIGKISCERLSGGFDADAQQAAKFVHHQLPKGSTTEQSWQFLGAAINHYCPDQRVALERAAVSR